MEIKDLLEQENVEIIDEVKDWKDACEQATKKLINEGYITHEYTEAIMRNAEKYNSYFVLCPGFALLHAETTNGVKKTQISATFVRKPVRFPGKDDDVKLMITLAAAKTDDHIEAIQSIAQLLGDDEKMNTVLNPESSKQLYNELINR